MDKLFSTVEDFDFPTVTAINGFAFGGGLEFALTTSYRVMSSDTRIGVPETKLGIFPGWGGTVRLSRLAGADNAIEWIAGGEQYDADVALKTGVVDAVVPPTRCGRPPWTCWARPWPGTGTGRPAGSRRSPLSSSTPRKP